MAESKLFSFLQKAGKVGEGVRKGVDVFKDIAGVLGNLSKDTDGDGKSQAENIKEACFDLEQFVAKAIKAHVEEFKQEVADVKVKASKLIKLLQGLKEKA